MKRFWGICLVLFSLSFIFIMIQTLSGTMTEAEETSMFYNLYLITFPLVILTFATKLILPQREPTVDQLKYSGFVIRTLSFIIDGIIAGVPFIIFMIYDEKFNGVSYTFTYLFLYISPYILNTYLLTKHGASIGKMICNLQVVNLDLSKVNFKVIAIRSAVDYTLVLLNLATILYHFNSIDILGLPSLAEVDRSILSSDPNNLINILLDSSYFIWITLEALFIILNKKSRALHDYLAGTVVVRKKYLNKSEIDD